MSIPPAIQSFIKSFYTASDLGPSTSPSSHSAYVSHFASSPTLIMGPSTFASPQEIHGFRESAWEKVEKRRHVVKGVFLPAQGQKEGEEEEVMLYGTVDYVYKSGDTKDGVEWAARMVFEKAAEGEDLKLQFYQVWLTLK